MKALFCHFFFQLLSCFPTSGSDLCCVLPEVSGGAQRAPVLQTGNHSPFLFLLEWSWPWIHLRQSQTHQSWSRDSWARTLYSPSCSMDWQPCLPNRSLFTLLPLASPQGLCTIWKVRTTKVTESELWGDRRRHWFQKTETSLRAEATRWHLLNSQPLTHNLVHHGCSVNVH